MWELSTNKTVQEDLHHHFWMEIKGTLFKRLKWLGGFVCRPATGETAGRKLTMQFEPVWEREQKGGRERERKPLMTHEDGASFEKQEKYIMLKAKESIFGVLLIIYFFFFKWDASKWKCSGNQWMGLTLQLLAGTYTLHHWVPMVMVCLCFFFLRVLSS